MSDMTAVIPKGTIINGNIEITGKMEMYGVVNGDIVSDDRVNLCGEIIGNISANDLYCKDSYIEGNINCKAGAVIRENSIVLGNLNSDSLLIDGALKGDLDVKGCITVGEKAIVESNIKAKSIQVSNGAALNGHCSLCYADIDMNTIFPESKTAKLVNSADKIGNKNRKNAS